MSPRQQPRVGIYGGTFDPIHLGHLIVAQFLAEHAGLERVVFVPSREPPHRPPARASANQRLEMIRLAVQGEPRLSVSPIEIERPGPSYSADTLELWTRRHPRQQPVFLIGIDAFLEIHTWRRFPELLRRWSFLVITRPAYPFTTLRQAHPAIQELLPTIDTIPDEDPPGGALPLPVKDAGTTITLTVAPRIDISASTIRRRIAEARSIRYMVPAPVAEYIEAHQLYRPTTTS
jgi:nicotinate-nucleotide adenylyltransferase